MDLAIHHVDSLVYEIWNADSIRIDAMLRFNEMNNRTTWGFFEALKLSVLLQQVVYVTSEPER